MYKTSMPTNRAGVRDSKIFYFFFFAAVASLMPFLALYYDQQGLTGTQIGLLGGISPLMIIFGSSFWGAIADLTNQHQRMMTITLAGAMAATLFLSFAKSLLFLIPAVTTFAFFLFPAVPLIDSSVLALLGTQSNRYGRVRLWGSIGWGVFAPITGWVVDQWGLGWTFYCFIGLMTIPLLISVKLPIQQAQIKNNFWRSVGVLLKNREWILFLTMIFLVGMGISIVNNFLFLYMDHLNTGRTVMGLALTLGTVSEMVIFFYADRLLKHWGTRTLLIFSVSAIFIRLTGYSLVDSAGPVLVLQLLHGLTFGTTLIAGVAYANQIAPPGMQATSQGLLSSVNFGVGGIAGAIMGGWLYDLVGPFLMFRWMGGAVLVGLVAFIVAGRRSARIAAKTAKTGG